MTFRKLSLAIASIAFLASCSSQRIAAGDQGMNTTTTTTTSTTSTPVSQTQTSAGNTTQLTEKGGSGEAVAAPARAVR